MRRGGKWCNKLPVNTDGTKRAELAVALLVPAATVLVVVDGGIQEVLGLKEVHLGASIEVGVEGHDQTLHLIDPGQLALNTFGGWVWGEEEGVVSGCGCHPR